MKRVVGAGGGGHAKVVIDILWRVGGYEIIGLLDAKRELWNTSVLGVPVLGSDDLLPRLRSDGVGVAFIGLGSIGETRPRRILYEKVRQHGFEIVSAVHPQAIIASSVELGHGVTIMAGAIVNASARLGDNVIVNTGAIIEHDCVIGNHVHVATGARLASTVCVGDGAHIGIGASVRQKVRIGANAIVGAGAVVVKDVPESVVVVGVPASVLRPTQGVSAMWNEMRRT